MNMKFLFQIAFAFLTLCIFSTSCEVLDEIDINDGQVTRFQDDYDLEPLNTIDRDKVLLSKCISRTLSRYPSGKKILFDYILQAKQSHQREFFAVNLFTLNNPNFSSEKDFRDLLVQYSGVSPLEIDAMINRICNDYPNIVIDIPPFVEWFTVHPEYKNTFLDTFASYPFVIIPDTHEPNENGKWVGYSDLPNMDTKLDTSFDETISYEFGPGEPYIDVIPFIVKVSELNLFLTGPRTLLNGNDILESYVGNNLDNTLEDCYLKQLPDLIYQINICGTDYDAVSYFDFLKLDVDCSTNSQPTTPEDCFDGIDNDGDGDIDCLDPDCNCDFEICDDGIDNDGDGDIDEDDSDCCYRDCRRDNNYLLRHGFDDGETAIKTLNNSVLGAETTTQLRYQITNLLSGCDTCAPIAGTFYQIVTAYTFGLNCYDPVFELPDIAGGDIYPTAFLSPSQISNYCLPNDIGYYSDHGNLLSPYYFLGGTVFHEDNSNPYPGNSIVFQLTDVLYASLYNTIGIQKPLLYVKRDKDWDASLIGDKIKLEIFEIDGSETPINIESSAEITKTTQIRAKFGLKLGIGESNAEAATSYNFTNQNQFTSSVTYTIKARDIHELGILSIQYCDSETDYPNFISLGLESPIYPTDASLQILDKENKFMNWWNVIQNTH